MADTDRAFVGSIPEIYDRLLGPMLFEPYARELAERLRGFEGELLETAAGTGRVTRALAEAAPGAAIIATDLNAPMLAQAAELVRAPNVRFQTADALALPFPAGRFDVVVCQFGAMFFPDKDRAFSEARRVLKPGGRFILSVWDDLACNPLSEVAQRAVEALFPEDPASFFRRIPFGWHDRKTITAALTRAGFGEIATEAVSLPTTAPSAADAAEGLCLGTPLRGELEAHGADAPARAVRAATAALQAAFGPGPISAPGQALVVTART
jgi:ubiquinone/menaquinone biosynthesis C-methylase UbiE